MTGLSLQATDLAGKRVELLREVLRVFRRLAILANIGFPGAALEISEAQAAARALGLETARRYPAGRGYHARFRSSQGPRGRTLYLRATRS